MDSTRKGTRGHRVTFLPASLCSSTGQLLTVFLDSAQVTTTFQPPAGFGGSPKHSVITPLHCTHLLCYNGPFIYLSSPKMCEFLEGRLCADPGAQLMTNTSLLSESVL